MQLRARNAPQAQVPAAAGRAAVAAELRECVRQPAESQQRRRTVRRSLLFPDGLEVGFFI